MTTVTSPDADLAEGTDAECFADATAELLAIRDRLAAVRARLAMIDATLSLHRELDLTVLWAEFGLGGTPEFQNECLAKARALMGSIVELFDEAHLLVSVSPSDLQH